MKKSILFFVLLLSCVISKANRIDSLKTDEDVIKFTNELLSKEGYSEGYTLSFLPDIYSRPCDSFFKPKAYTKWGKADFNNDGLTDIFINGNEGTFIWVIFGSDKNNYAIKNIHKRYLRYSFANALKNEGGGVFAIVNTKDYYDLNDYLPNSIDTSKTISISYLNDSTSFKNPPAPYIPTYRDTVFRDTLQYVLNDFIEVNKNPIHHHIEYIHFNSLGGLGGPMINTYIDSAGNVSCQISKLNLDTSFRKSLPPSLKDSLYQILDFINFPQLKDSSYSINAIDILSVNLYITYDGNKTKEIRDYGAVGTYGLIKLYKLLFKISGENY